jgi:polyferredoxin
VIFQQSNIAVNPVTMVLVFVTWALITVTATLLLKKRTMTRKKASILLALSVFVGGLVLGALPNPIQPINQVLLAMRGVGVNATLIPMVLALGALLVSTIMAGRAFCGYACPLGALQEAISRLKFKSSTAEQRGVKGAIALPERAVRYIRIVVFAILATITVVWGIAIIQLTSPFLGFRVFVQPGIIAIAIPVAVLVMIAVTGAFVYRPWCRLACPFGTIAWGTSRFSKFKLHRTGACTDCGLCEKVCPVDEAARGSSPEGCDRFPRWIGRCQQGKENRGAVV